MKKINSNILSNLNDRHMRTSTFSIAFLLITILFLGGCVVLDKYEMSSNSIDLSKFEKEGIFVTTGDLSQKYKSVSILVSNCYDGYISKTDAKKKIENKKEKIQRDDDVYSSSTTAGDKLKNFNYKLCSLDDLFADLIRQTKNIGANGLIKLEINNINRPGISSKTAQRGIEIVGLAVRIE